MTARFIWQIAAAIATLAGLLVFALALPFPAWRPGRVDAPPLDLVAGGPAVALSERIWIDTDAACGASPATDYGGPITAMIAAGNVAGTQFHPEKSQTLGLKLIANFLKWNP